jgi:hypothetical protein
VKNRTWRRSVAVQRDHDDEARIVSRGSWGDTALRSILWLLLGGWVGAWFLFAFGVSTTAFQVLPSTELAGQVVGPLLAGLHFYAAAAGAVLAVVTLGMGRGPLLAGMPLLLAALCIYSELGITGEIDAIRAQAFGPAATLEVTERFGVLHRRSLTLFTAVGIGAIALVVAHSRRDALLARVETPTQ